MSFDDFFGFQDATLTKDQEERKINPVIYSDDNPQLYIIADHYFKDYEISKFKEIISKKLGDIYISIKIIYPFKFIPSQKELSKQLALFYQDNTIDLSKEIPPYSKIIVMGRSINAITFNTDIDVEAFYDINFNKQYFYAPKLLSYVFPIDSYWYWWGKDNWKNHFAFLQFKNALDFEVKKIRVPKLNIIIPDDCNDFLRQNMEEKEVAWDIETSGFNFMTDRIGCITMAFDEKTGYFLDWKKIDKKLLNEFFKNKYNVLANGKYDCKFLRYNEINNVKVDFDTLQAGHVLNEMRSNSLKTHAWLYSNYGGYEQALEDYKRKYKATKSYLDIPYGILSEYATTDAIVTFQVYKQMKNQLLEIDKKAKYMNNNWTTSKYYYDVMMPAVNAFLDIEYRGWEINWEFVRKAGSHKEEIKNKIQEIINELNNVFGLEGFNWGSNEKIGELLEKCGWDDFGISKKGIYLVNDETLSEWSKQGKKEADLILKLHELNTIYNTFIGDEENGSGYWQYKYPDNKVHGTYSVMLADSGRNKCRNPNLTNVPAQGDYATLIKSFYKPYKEDHVLAEVDAAGIQLRVGAILSGDENMRKAFIELSGDLHSVTSATILLNNKISVEDFIKQLKVNPSVYKPIRKKAKFFNFACEFGASAITIAEQLKGQWSEEDVDNHISEFNLHDSVKRFIKNEISESRGLTKLDCKYWAVANDIKRKYFNLFEGLAEWHTKTIQFASENGYIVSPFGCIRRLPQLMINSSEGSRETKNLQNISLNTTVQNYEAVLINYTIFTLNNWLKENNMKSVILGTVHDSIVLSLQIDEINIVMLKLKEIFEKEREENKGIPLEVEGNISDYYGKNEYWGFGKSYDFENTKNT